jgi:hypothetical protein
MADNYGRGPTGGPRTATLTANEAARSLVALAACGMDFRCYSVLQPMACKPPGS